MNVLITEDTEKSQLSYEWESFEDAQADTAEISKQYRLGSMIVESNDLRKQRQGYMSSQYWYGTDGWFEGMMDRVQNGWPEMRMKVERMATKLGLEVPVFPTTTTLRKRKRKRDDHGDSLDITRVWNGELDTAWERPVHVERQQVNQKRVTLAFDIGGNCNMSNEQAMWRAALCHLLVDGLARAGRTMEIHVTASFLDPFEYGERRVPRYVWESWCVKKTNDPIVPDRLAAMFSIGYFRSIGFIGMRAGKYKPTSSLGQAMNRGLPHTLQQRANNGETVLRIGQCFSKEQALAEYTRAFKAIDFTEAA